MKQVPDSLLAFQHMFPDDDACAAWLIEMRWPDGFVCPACGHEKGWALRRKAHTFEWRRLPPADLGDGRDDPARQQAAAHRLVLGRLPDGDPLQRHLCPAAPETARYRLLPQRLACSPTSCAPAWSTPSATRCRARWKSTRPAFHSGPKTILPPEGKDAATTARCSSSAPSNSGTETSQAACGWPKSPPTAPPTSDTSSETAADPDAIAKTDGWSGYAAVPADRHNVHVVGKTAAHLVLPWIHQVFSNLKGWARGVYHGLRRKHLQAYLDEFVFRFNRRKTRHAAFRLALPPRHQCRTPYLQHVDRTGAMCISGLCKIQ